ncbi:hypothetical protein B0F90DRAFT_1625956 [Multifurca ochricompacta]|uniref:Uncharacterized protein n=1 Tax=Multifurca ochricompacta TaxID=376703 RepID=A0AAD4QML4_9AGAM|nr:hypothetical protein B0F90DRAFT_1625956 [Multifurca ochricompacta]
MSFPSPSDDSPWPAQTPPPSHSRKRRILSPLPPLEHRTLFARQQVFNQSGVAEALQQCEFFSSNSVRSCFPTTDTIVPQHEWATFVWNSRLPDLTQTNQVNIYLFHADSGDEVLRVTDEVNPFGRAGSIAKQVNDSWFPNGGVNFNGTPISYPFYWVITRSDKTLDGTEIPQSTFSAVQTTLADSVTSSIASASSAAAASAVSASVASASAAAASSSVAAASSSRNHATQTAGSLQSNSQSDFPHWAIAVIVVLGFLAILAMGVLGFLLVRRAKRNQSARTSRRGSIGSASPMIAGAAGAGGAPQSPVMEQAPSAFASVAPRPASVYSPNDGSSMISHTHSTDTPFSGADAAIMADAFRKALRKPDFADRPIEEGDSPEAQEQKEHRLLSRELAEEGRDIRSVGSSRDVRVETLSDAEDKVQDPR